MALRALHVVVVEYKERMVLSVFVLFLVPSSALCATFNLHSKLQEKRQKTTRTCSYLG